MSSSIGFWKKTLVFRIFNAITDGGKKMARKKKEARKNLLQSALNKRVIKTRYLKLPTFLFGFLLARLVGARSGPRFLTRFAVDDVLQLLTGAEGRNLARRNSQRSKCAGVAASSGLTGAALESAEANEGYLFSLRHSACDCMKKCAQCFADLDLRLTSQVCDFADQLSTVHNVSSLSKTTEWVSNGAC